MYSSLHAQFRRFVRNAVAFTLFLLLAGPTAFGPNYAQASEAMKNTNTPKKALVLFTFGTTYKQTQDPLAPVRAEFAARFPGMRIVTAYSSVHVLKALRAKGIAAQSLPEALAGLAAEGYTQAMVQSLHVVPGLEYQFTVEIADRFSGMPKGLEKVGVGMPLAASHEDCAALAGLLLADLPKDRPAADAVVYVGHGADNPVGSLAYPALQGLLQEHDPRAFVGTIEGPFTAGRVRDSIKAAGAKRVFLVPLLTVLGDHAQNDIFGEEADSWASQFAKAGLTVIPVRKGLADVPGVPGLWADHAEAALKSLE